MRKRWIQAMAMLLPALTGCLKHTRKVMQVSMPGVVMSASGSQLVDSINKQYDAIDSLNAKVEFRASAGGAKKGKVTDYTSFSGYILLRKPENLRVLGLVPVLHTIAFDLASDGQTFKLYIPIKNKAIVGSNSVTVQSTNPIENLRPNIFFDSLLIHSIGPDELYSITNQTKTVQDSKKKRLIVQPDYDLNVLRKQPDSNELIPERVIHFSRIDLLPYEEDIYDKNGDIETQALYGPYQTFGTAKFPGIITIRRPLEEYQIVITIQKLTVNQKLNDNQFQMKIPAGVQTRIIK
ncbi:hypothetical protein C7378_2527 [Acidipila rosea]|uniref:DUF4292 domain-containing protein n=2 Tax=Acidipila rosea TaxID=768535 RepID=A0A4R1L1S0_9BACT|nr:hypothetical protein C7378_2527 [Acidipila rosea]